MATAAQTPMTIDQMIEAAQQDARTIRTVTRCDGTTCQGPKNYASVVDGTRQVYVVPVTARTVARQEHYRATFYLLRDGKWKRVSRAAFAAEGM